MSWNDAYKAKIYWKRKDEGGRVNPAMGDQYYPIAIFPHESINSIKEIHWSVTVKIIKTYQSSDGMCSDILVKYLWNEKAPNENFLKYDNFDIYEGGLLVGNVKLEK